jgi:hypothetical protein
MKYLFELRLGRITMEYYEKTFLGCWLWSLIIFLIQRSLFLAVFIPHEDFTPWNNVHSSTRGSVEGGYPLWALGGPMGTSKAPEGKIPCKCIL